MVVEGAGGHSTMRIMSGNIARRWTAEDDAIPIEMAARGGSADQVARKLLRTTEGVVARAEKLIDVRLMEAVHPSQSTTSTVSLASKRFRLVGLVESNVRHLGDEVRGFL